MDTEKKITDPSAHPSPTTGRFSVGATVIYGLHGKCTVTRIESRQIAETPIEFYRIEVQKSPLSRSSRHEPAIWVPVESAAEKGMRSPANASDAAKIMELLSSREYFFSLKDPWHLVQSNVEAAVREEGLVGLAKAASYLHVLKSRNAVLPREVLRLRENINKLLLRELSEALEEPATNVESRVALAMRRKLLPSS